ncbi:MAG: hypothetical protein ACLFNC_04135 [Halodesulfurarchaeum sp.]
MPKTRLRAKLAVWSPRGRAQIGAGTIVILIAVLVVAATTAGVLFNVTGVLQSQAGVTGDTVGSAVESPIRVAAVTGRVAQTDTPPAINRARVVIALDGSDAVELDDATVRFESSASHETLVYDPTGPVEGESFDIDPLVDPDGSAPTLSETADRFAIEIETSSLVSGDRVRIQINFESGASKAVRVRVPEEIADETAVTME